MFFFSSQNLVQSNKDWRGTNEGCECSTELNLQCSWSGTLSMSAGLQHMHWCQTLTAISKLRQVSLPRIRGRGWSETVEVSKNGRRSRIMGGRCGKSANTITGHALPATSRLTEMKNKLFVSRLQTKAKTKFVWQTQTQRQRPPAKSRLDTRWRTNFLFPGSRSVLLWLFFEAITTLQDTGGCRRRSIRRYKCFLWSSCSLGLLIGVSELWWFCAKSNVDIITDRVCCSIDFTLCVAFLDVLVLFHFFFPAVACHGFEFFDCHCRLHVSIVSP